MERIHKFQSVNEKLGKIKSTIFQPKPDSESAFLDCFALMHDLFLTSAYSELRSKLQPKSRALLEILYFKAEIVDLLLEYLPIEPEPCLKLLVALSIDLVDELVPFLLKILEAIVQLVLQNPSPEVLQITFQSLVYLLKNLVKWMVKDIQEYLLCLEPLLLNEKVQVFVAESLGLLIRKSKDYKSTLRWIVDRIAVHGNSRATALLIFECVKMNNRVFYSKTPLILQHVIELGTEVDLELMLEFLFVCIGHHGTPESMRECWDVLLGFKCKSEQQKVPLRLVYIWSGLRKGVRIPDRPTLLQYIKSGFEKDFKGNEKEWLRIFAVFLLSSSFQELLSSRSIFIEMHQSKNLTAVLEFYLFLRIQRYEFFQFIFQDFLTFAQTRWEQDNCGILIVLKNIFEDVKLTEYVEKLPDAMKQDGVIKMDGVVEDLIKTIAQTRWDLAEEEELEQIGIVHAACQVLPQLVVNWDSLERVILKAMNMLVEELTNNQEYNSVAIGRKSVAIQGVLADLISMLSQIAQRLGKQENMEQIWNLIIETVLPKCTLSLGYLNATFKYLSTVALTLQKYNIIFNILQENVGVFSHMVRLKTLEILDLFDVQYLNREDTVFKGRCMVLKT
jgi:hypothetical protein